MGEKLRKVRAEDIINNISLDNMMETIRCFSRLHRYTGYPQAEEAADYILKHLECMGIPCKRMEYEAYLGLPLQASLLMTEPEQLEIPVIADAFSGEGKGILGELLYLGKEYWNEENLKTCEGKILLSDMGAEAAEAAGAYGAAAFVHISITDGDIIHHRTAGTVWGNPTLSDWKHYPRIPSLNIGRADAEKLRRLAEQQRVQLVCSVKMDSHVRKSSMPVARINGQTDKYILISGHYDSWYEGITDNAAANAILLELARLLWQERQHLTRGVCFAWWSGHSDGRYAGSAWYCENYWEDLRKNCVAHINLDLCGCKNAKRVSARATGMEALHFTSDVIERFTGRRPPSYIPMIRGADQSFWGINIPISIMLKYEPEPEERTSPCPGGGPWWHTASDTMDKLDPELLVRDAKMNGLLAASLCMEPVLPIDIEGFINEMEHFLRELDDKLLPEFHMLPVWERLERLKLLCRTIQEYLRAGRLSDDFIKDTAGELVRVTYSEKSRYEQDEAAAARPFPGLQRAVAVMAHPEPELKYLAAKTTFVRQRNRLADSLEQVIRRMERRIEEGEESNERKNQCVSG